jgi:hypothetical protein
MMSLCGMGERNVYIFRCLVIPAVFIISGCTFVKTTAPLGGVGDSYVTLGGGVPKNLRGVIAYRSEMLGLGWGQRGIIFGWQREEGVRTEDLGKCQIIIFELPSDRVQAEKWRELIAGRPDICLIKRGNSDVAK